MKALLLIFAFLISNSLQANDAAIRISEGAASSGTRVLIIGFEGLAGFNSAGSNQASIYQCQLSHGLPARKPGGIGGQVLKSLAVPVIEKYKNQVKVLIFAHDSCKGSGSLPEAIAAQWMADANKSENTKGRRVIILGHSFGGDAAVILGRSLAARGVSVDSVFTMDPRKRPIGTGGFQSAGSARWVNFYQKLDAALMGWEIAGAENNYLWASPILGHIMLPKNPKILSALMAQIGEPPGEKVLADGGKIPGVEKNGSPSAGKDMCSAEMLGEAGIYRGTSGMIEAVPIAAVVGGGGYLAYQALSGKGGGAGGGGKKSKGSKISANSVGTGTISEASKTKKPENSEAGANLKTAPANNTIRGLASDNYDSNANRARSSMKSSRELLEANPALRPVVINATKVSDAGKDSPLHAALAARAAPANEQMADDPKTLESHSAEAGGSSSAQEKSEEEQEKSAEEKLAKEEGEATEAAMLAEEEKLGSFFAENAEPSIDYAQSSESIFQRVSKKIKSRMR